MNGFIFASGVNDPNHGYGHDSSGAFRPGAEAFKEIHAIPQEIFFFDYRLRAAELRSSIINTLLTLPCPDPTGLDVVAYFGHGIRTELTSAGFRLGRDTNDVVSLAKAISATCKHDVRVVLYACDAGQLPKSFAWGLANALNSFGGRVYGHQNTRHAFCNPHVTVFETGGIGRYLVEQGSPYWSGWARQLRAAAGHETEHTLWATFPFMTEDELHAACLSATPAPARGRGARRGR